jgi:hypothetical protein
MVNMPFYCGKMELREATADERPFIVETLGKSFGNTDEEAESIYQAIESDDRITFIQAAFHDVIYHLKQD